MLYALCEVISDPFPGSGARDRFWYGSFKKDRDWPTVRIRYLRSYLDNPLLIETLGQETPSFCHQLLRGWQGSSFPIPKSDFNRILTLLNESEDTFGESAPQIPVTADEIKELERRYADAAPEIREAIGRRIERGPIGDAVKRSLGFKCQICMALGENGTVFKKASGEWYAEAHHVVFVGKLLPGSLSASNIIVVCPNHHRQLHYGGIEYSDDGGSFTFQFPQRIIKITKNKLHR